MVSIILVFRIFDEKCHETWKMTKKSIEGLMKTIDMPFELFIVDNGSYSDKFVSEVKEIITILKMTHPTFIQRYMAMRFHEHVSLGKAWNEAINQSQGEFIIIANNDIVYFDTPENQKSWIKRMIEPFTDPKMGIVGIQHMSWGPFGGFTEGSLFCFPSKFKEEFNLTPDETRVELMDENFMFICDVDLNHRLHLKGYKTVQVNNPPLQPLWLQHLGHRTIQDLQLKEDFVKITHEDRVALCIKHGFDPQVVD